MAVRTNDDRQHVADVISKSKVALLTTTTVEVNQVSRPMSLQAWIPDKLETPGLTLIKIRASTAEYWTRPTSTVGFVLGVVPAAVTKNPDNDPISNSIVEL